MPEVTLNPETIKQLTDIIGKSVFDQIKTEFNLTGLDKQIKIGEDLSNLPLRERKTNGFKSFGEYLITIRNNPNDPRLEALLPVQKTGLSEASDTEGGFLVPTEFNARIMMDELETAVIRPRATVIPMGSDSMEIPRVVDTTHASTVFGGVLAYWNGDPITVTGTQPTIGQVKLIAKTLVGYTYASNNLLADSAIALEALLIRMFSAALAYYEDDAFINGNGVNKPFGILSSSALLAANRSAASAFAISDAASLISRMSPASLSRGVFLANPNIISKLVQLGSTYMTWLGAGSALTQGMPGVLFGRPIGFTEKLPAIGTAGDICFLDLAYYLIGDRQQLEIAASTHARFTTGETAWRFVKRVDGQPWIDSKFTMKAGGTVSPFVTLHSTTNGGD